MKRNEHRNRKSVMTFCKKAICLAMVAMMVFGMTACGNSTEKNAAEESAAGQFPEAIKIGYQPVANDMMIAIVEGSLENLGFPYELVEFSSGKDLNNALASGSVDVGYIGTVPVVSGISTDLGYEVFWISGIITECEGLVVKEGINSVADLEGKNIGVVTGSTSHYSLMSALENAGVAVDSVNIIGGGTTEIVAMWDRGDIDAAYIWQPSLEAMIDAGGTVIFDGNNSKEIGATTAVLHVVNKSFAEKYPDAVKALVKVLDSTQDTYAENPDKVVEDVAARLEMDKDMCKTSIEGYGWIPMEEQATEEYLGGEFVNVLKNTADFLAEQGSITASPDVSVLQESMTAEFVK